MSALFSAPLKQDAAPLSRVNYENWSLFTVYFLIITCNNINITAVVSQKQMINIKENASSRHLCKTMFFTILYFSRLFYFSFFTSSVFFSCVLFLPWAWDKWLISIFSLFFSSSRPPTVAHRSCFHHNTLDTSVFCLACEGFCQAVRLKANTKSSVHFSSGSSSPWSNFEILKTAYSQDMVLKATELPFGALLKVFNWKKVAALP